MEDMPKDMPFESIFGEGTKNIYALDSAQVIYHHHKEVQLAVNNFFDGRCVYFGGVDYNPHTARMVHRAILWACGSESSINQWFSTNPNVEVHYYPNTGKCAVCNNSHTPQSTVVHKNGSHVEMALAGGELAWITI